MAKEEHRRHLKRVEEFEKGLRKSATTPLLSLQPAEEPVILKEQDVIPLSPLTAVEQVRHNNVQANPTIVAATSTKLPNLLPQPELPVQVLQAESVNAPVQVVKTNPAVQAPINHHNANRESVEIHPAKYERNNTVQLLEKLHKDITGKRRTENNKLIITEEEKQQFLERFNKIPSRNDPEVEFLTRTITELLEKASIPNAPKQIVPIRSPRVSNSALKRTRNTIRKFKRSKLSREIVALNNDIKKIENNPSANQKSYTALLNQIADILKRIKELNVEKTLGATISQLKESQIYLQTKHDEIQVRQNATRPANWRKQIAEEPDEKSMESEPIETPIKPIGSLKQDVNKVKSEELPKRITELETIARNIHDLSIKKRWKISKETYITLKNKYNQLKSTVNTTLKSNKNAMHINTLTKLVANNSKTIEKKLGMNAIDNIIKHKALPGNNPIVVPVSSKSAVKSEQLPTDTRNSLAALLKKQIQQEQANYLEQQRAHTRKRK